MNDVIKTHDDVAWVKVSKNVTLCVQIAGKPNKLIATRLTIALRTTELRRASILKKMKACSFAELIRLTIELRQYEAADPAEVSSLNPARRGSTEDPPTQADPGASDGT